MSTTRANLEFFDSRPEGVAEAVRRLSEFDRGQEVRRVSADYAVAFDDDLILVTTGAAAIVITLPLASEAQRKLYHVKKIDAGAGTVVVTPRGTDTAEGGATYVIAVALDTASFLPEAGVGWWLV